MRSFYIFLFVGLFLIEARVFADVTIITNNEIDVSKDDIDDIFSGDKLTVGAIKLNLVENRAIIDEFCKKVMKMDSSKYMSQWAKKSFRDGVSIPKMKNSDTEVLDYVKSTPGGVGYISGGAPAGVKAVAKY